jgi:hypothetical protein
MFKRAMVTRMTHCRQAYRNLHRAPPAGSRGAEGEPGVRIKNQEQGSRGPRQRPTLIPEPETDTSQTPSIILYSESASRVQTYTWN